MRPCQDAQSIDPSSLARIGRALLGRVEDLYAELGVALPARHLWAAGDVPFDCEQLVVSLRSLAEGLVHSDSGFPDACNPPATATFGITVVRCVPVPDNNGNPPSPAEIAAAADASAMDAYILQKAACQFDMYGEDVPGAPLGGMGVDVSVEVESASGGLQAVTATLTTVIG